MPCKKTQGLGLYGTFGTPLAPDSRSLFPQSPSPQVYLIGGSLNNPIDSHNHQLYKRTEWFLTFCPLILSTLHFWKFYLVRISSTLGEPVSLVIMFRLFRLEWIVLVFRVWKQSVDVQTSYLLAGPACLFCLVFNKSRLFFLVLRYLVMNNFFKRDGYVDPTISLFQ